jgi:hypothetical protein
MTDWKRPGDGDIEIAAAAVESGAATAVGERSGAGEELVEDGGRIDVAESDKVVRTKTRTRPSNVTVLLGVIVAVVVAQAIISWLSFDVTRQLRDQAVIAGGLQRCLIQAQLNENTSTDPSGAAYKTAVQRCLNK